MGWRALRQDEFNLTRLFKVIIDNLEAADFHEVHGLTSQIDVLEYREGGLNDQSRKLIGQNRFTNLVLRRGTSSSTEFWKWIQDTMNGKIERKTGTIQAVGKDNTTPVIEWKFFEAWPCRYKGADFTTLGGDNIAVEELELAIARFELVRAG